MVRERVCPEEVSSSASSKAIAKHPEPRSLAPDLYPDQANNISPYRPSNDSQPRKPILNEANKAQPEPPPQSGHSKRPLSFPEPPRPTRTLSAIGALNLGAPRGSDDIAMQDASEDDRQTPRKRLATGDGISAGSASPFREQSPEVPPPRRAHKGRPNSAPYGASEFDSSRPNVRGKQLWTPDQNTPISRPSVDPSNIASFQAQKSRQQAQRLPPSGKVNPSQGMSLQSRNQNMPQDSSFSNTPTSPKRPQRGQSIDDTYDILRQPETRPISQEQLVAEVKGIYAGLVMVEARCIEVDGKHATLAQADPTSQPKLNNEQWQALIALHRTLLHEHHDFFLASQHPSASIALRRLASKYAMPARMWRHGIHSFLELLRHRLPASLDHMLAFIYLAYSMMALLYETVPAFEDTWIECLGDLARYRMAIEDDDIRDREVWTGVARQWYSKASDKAPTTGRLYHHLAILARPNALQQLFYYSKSLCVEIPFTSARESILTLFEPVMNAVGPAQYRLPPLDTAFVKAHGQLFTGKHMDKFEETVKDFHALLDSQIGRVTRKFMEQGYHIAVANSVAMMGFAAPDNVLMKAIASSRLKMGLVSKDNALVNTVAGEQTESVSAMTPAPAEDPLLLMAKFRHAESLSNRSFEIVLQRIGDPNVLPFIHVTLVYILYVSTHTDAMSLIEDDLPWSLLSAMLNTLLGSHKTPARIEDDKFPLPEKDAVHPFPEDYAMRGLLWTVPYFPEQWFNNEKIDEEEKYREAASMTDQRKERILWLAVMISKRGPWLKYTRERFSVPEVSKEPTTVSVPESEISVAVVPLNVPDYEPEIISPGSRTLTSESATTVGSIERKGTWETGISDADQDLPSPSEHSEEKVLRE